MKKYLANILTILVIIFFGLYIYNNFDDFLVLGSISPAKIFSLLCLYGATFITNAYVYKIFFAYFNQKIDMSECVSFSIYSGIANLVMPFRSGAVARAVYFKNKFGLGITDFVSILGGTYLISFAVLAVSGLIGIFALSPEQNAGYYLLVGFLCLILFCCLIPILFKVSIPDKFIALKLLLIGKIFGKLAAITKAWNDISKSKKILWKLVLMVVINFLLTVAIAAVEFETIGISLAFAQLVLYSALSGLSMFVSITPSALGIREFVFILTSQIMGIGNQAILNVAVIDRMVLVLFLIGAYLVIKLKSGYVLHNFRAD